MTEEPRNTGAQSTVGAHAGTVQAATARTGLLFRPMVWEDYDALNALFARIWPSFTQDGAGLGRLVTRYYTLMYFTCATDATLVFTADGELAGATVVQVDGRPLLFPQASDEIAQVRRQMEQTDAGRRALSEIVDGFLLRERILEEDSDIHEIAQAELLLYMVNPDMRGHDVGGKLWRLLMRTFAREGVRSFFLHTDSSCDFAFYDHKKLERVAERYHADHPEDDDVSPNVTEDQFIYRGDVTVA